MFTSITSLAKRVLLRAGGTFAVKVAAAGAGLGAEIALARLFEPKYYGQYAYLYTWTQIALIPATLGFTTASIRFVSEYDSGDCIELLKGFCRLANRVVIVVSALCAISVVLSVTSFAPNIDVTLAVLAASSIPIASYGRILDARIKGLGDVVLAQLPFAGRRIVWMAVLFCLLVLSATPSLNDIFILYLSLTAIAVAVLVALWTSRKSRRYRKADERWRTKEWLSAAVFLLLVGGLTVLLVRVDTVMVGSLLDTSRAGRYNIASRLVTGIVLLAGAVRAAVAPSIAPLIDERNTSQLQEAVHGVVGVTLAGGIAVALMLVTFPDAILSLFGEYYREASDVLIVLTCGQVLALATGPGMPLLTMSGSERIVAAVLSGALIVNIGLNWLLIPVLGELGAALATSISLVGWNVLLAIISYKRVSVLPIIGGGWLMDHR